MNDITNRLRDKRPGRCRVCNIPTSGLWSRYCKEHGDRLRRTGSTRKNGTITVSQWNRPINATQRVLEQLSGNEGLQSSIAALERFIQGIRASASRYQSGLPTIKPSPLEIEIANYLSGKEILMGMVASHALAEYMPTLFRNDTHFRYQMVRLIYRQGGLLSRQSHYGGISVTHTRRLSFPQALGLAGKLLAGGSFLIKALSEQIMLPLMGLAFSLCQ